MVDVTRVILAQSGVEQCFEVESLPLSIGGSATSEIRIPISDDSQEVASIGVLEGSAFIQTARSREPIHVNTEILTGPRRISDGDVIRIATTKIVCSIRGDSLRLERSSTAAEPGTHSSGNELRRNSETNSAATTRRYPRPAVIATWGIGLFLVVLLWFSFTAVSVRLLIEPAPDSTDVPTSLLVFHIGERYLLRPGQHEIVAEKAGYYRLEQAVEVTSAPDQEIMLTLSKLPGVVEVSSHPVDGATVTIDAEEVGITPLEGLPIPAGPHILTVRAPRHLPASLEITVEGGGEEQRFDVDLIPAWASISIESDPPHASVWVESAQLGETPGAFDLDAGIRSIELRLEGYNPWKQQIEVISDEPQSLGPIVLAKADAQLRIESDPPGAQVVVDNASPGRTPLAISVASEVAHEISLFKVGHELASRTIELKPGEQQDLHFRLVARIGVIELITDPVDATILFDGKSIGKSSRKLRLLSSPHSLTIRKEGYQEKRVTVTPRPDYPQRIEVKLDRAGEPAPTIVRGVTTALGQKLILTHPGTFTMGSRRGEPGRRPNETERTVKLTRAFYISVHEVTNRDFRQFSPEHAPAPSSGFELADDVQPAVWVTWQDAIRFCNWLSVKEGLPPAYKERQGDFVLTEPIGIGYRLPTEAEWAWAARFAAGASNQRFPWGDSPDPPPGSGNYADSSAAGIVLSALLSYQDGFPVTAPVGANGSNPLGLFDVGGNVAEWVHDRYRIYPPSRAEIPVEDPAGPQIGGLRVIRGSSWKHASETPLRLTFRDYGKEGRDDVGFRIARYQR